MFILVHPGHCWVHLVSLVHSGAPWGHWVHSGSLGSFGCALGVVGFLLVPWWSLGSFGVVGLAPWGRWDHTGSLGSFGCALGVVGFIRGRWVHSDASCWSLGLFGDVGFIPVHSGCR